MNVSTTKKKECGKNLALVTVMFRNRIYLFCRDGWYFRIFHIMITGKKRHLNEQRMQTVS